MSKSFSTREKTLLVILGILLAAALYYLGVFMPTSEMMRAAQNELNDVAELMVIEEEKAARLRTMREALADLGEVSGTRTITPLYDNSRLLLDELNGVLRFADNYKLNFLEPEIEDGIAKRELQLTFNTRNYYAAESIIYELYTGPYHCNIISFQMVPAEKDVANMAFLPMVTTMSILYYEIVK